MASLSKFFNRTQSRGQKLYWGRAQMDGAPFRGQAPPLLTEDEYEQRVVRVVDVQAEFFDISKKDQKRAYLDVLDGAANGWFRILYIKRFRKSPSVHYVEWAEFYLEDGSQVRAGPGVGMEVANGVRF